MMDRVESRLDGATLVVRIPMRFQRRGGRKRIVAPDGSEVVPTSKPHPDGTLVKALARAWRWQRLLDGGVYSSVSEIGDAENISKSYVSRIVRLALLAPHLVEGIVQGRADQSADVREPRAAAAERVGGAAAGAPQWRWRLRQRPPGARLERAPWANLATRPSPSRSTAGR